VLVSTDLACAELQGKPAKQLRRATSMSQDSGSGGFCDAAETASWALFHWPEGPSATLQAILRGTCRAMRKTPSFGSSQQRAPKPAWS